MKKVTRKSTYKQYHLEPDGSLEFVGIVPYTYVTEEPPPERTRVMAQTEAMIAAANACRIAAEDDMERIADAACELGENGIVA